VLALIALGLLLALIQPVAVRATSPIRILSREESAVFADSLHFRLQVEAESPMVEAILYYGREGDRLVRRIYPSFGPDQRVLIEHVEELEPGQFAPGTRLRVWWRLQMADGSSVTTEETTLDYADDRFAWRPLAGERVILYWYGRDESRAQALFQRAEEALGLLEEDIGVMMDRPVNIYVYSSQVDMSRALSRRSEGYDDRVLTLGVAVNEDTLLVLGSHRDAGMVVAHELSHIVVGQATDNPYTDLPRWLDEGLAMYAEGELPQGNRRALDQAVRNDTLLSLRSMSSYSGQAEQVDLFYGSAYSVVDFMLDEYGRDKMRALLGVFGRGTLQDDALREVYGFGLDDLDAQWRQSLGLAPRPVGTPESSRQADALPVILRDVAQAVAREVWPGWVWRMGAVPG
jgi:hypothetical protein